MRLTTTRRRIRILRKGLAMLVAVYGQKRSIRQVAGNLWFVATRQGLIGMREWLLSAAPPAPPAPPGLESPPAIDPQALYEAWLARFDPLHEQAAARRHLATLDLPELLIIAVLTRESLGFIGEMLSGWQSSLHPGWHAAILPPLGLPDGDIDALRAAIAAEPRVSIAAPEEIAALRRRFGHTLLARGAVRLNPLSAYMFLEAAIRTEAGIVYCDHDRIDTNGRRSAPAFKPQFSPDYLAHFNYIGDCLLLACDIALPAELPATPADHDRLVARLAIGQRVEHLPHTLFHMLDDTSRLSHDLPEIPDTGPGVAIIIPTRDGLDHLRPCIDSILETTSYDLGRVDIIVVDNNSVEPETHDYLRELSTLPNLQVLAYPHGFNFAEINNVGARATTREILVFLNNDTVVHDPAWLSKLVFHANRPGVGVVGAKLIFPDGTIQHGGCVAGASLGTVQHLLGQARPEEVAGFDHTREMSVVTGACAAIRRDRFWQVGGFDPILQITWNDVKTCLECLAAGLRNIYIADPLLIHDESRTRGQDNTRAHFIRYFSEADYTRRRFRAVFHDDPSYSPNLSLDMAGDLAHPPRVRRPWSRLAGEKLRILILSSVYRIGFGVPVVIVQHASRLVALGHDVIIGGPHRDHEFDFPGCTRVILDSVAEAAAYAFTHDVALIISHTPPFFELPVVIGGHIPVLAYDYGEPSAEFFPEPTRSYLLEVGYQKRRAAALTTTIATISQAVKDETLNKDAIVLGLANSHLPAWSEALRPERDRFRASQGWQDGFVVLTVCRFHENERAYKGLDKIASILREFPYLYPGHARPMIWALAGAGTPEDVEQVEQLGFTVFPNVSDEMLADLYKSADAYMGFSKWEGYNLGISQALAMGLPTLGSDIPAHREFPIATTNSTLAACAWLSGEVVLRRERQPIVYEWERSAQAFAELVDEMLRTSAVQAPRMGASGWDIPA